MQRSALLFGVVIITAFFVSLLTGCGGAGNDWKKLFEESSTYSDSLPSNDFIHESPYSVTNFETTSVSGSKNIVEFKADVENDYFQLEYRGYGEENNGKKEITTAELTAFKAKKPADNFEGTKLWYLDGESFELNGSGDGCTANVNADIDVWFGTVHAEGPVTMEVSTLDGRPSWKPTINSEADLSIKSYSSDFLSTFHQSGPDSEGHAAVVQTIEFVKGSGDGVDIHANLPEFPYRNAYSSHLSKPEQWTSPSGELVLTYKDKDGKYSRVESKKDGTGFRLWFACEGERPAEDKWRLEYYVSVTCDSQEANKVELEDTITYKGTGFSDGSGVMNMNDEALYVLEGVYAK